MLAAWHLVECRFSAASPALSRLEQEFGLPHALASRSCTDGAEVLYDYAQHSPDDETGEALRDLVVVSSGQRVFNDVVSAYRGASTSTTMSTLPAAFTCLPIQAPTY